MEEVRRKVRVSGGGVREVRSTSGVHRLFEGQGWKEGHFWHVLAPKRALKRKFWLQSGHFSASFGSQEGT